jgi:hypothetical protein
MLFLHIKEAGRCMNYIVGRTGSAHIASIGSISSVFPLDAFKLGASLCPYRFTTGNQGSALAYFLMARAAACTSSIFIRANLLISFDISTRESRRCRLR